MSLDEDDDDGEDIEDEVRVKVFKTKFFSKF
jgi:hypothetical protein